MNTLQAGFSRVNITPPLGIDIVGYYQSRYASGVLDELEINALALAAGDDKVLLLSADLCYIAAEPQKTICEHLQKVTGLTKDQIFIHATHTHTGPVVNTSGRGLSVFTNDEEKVALAREYFQILLRKFADAALLALRDLNSMPISCITSSTVKNTSDGKKLTAGTPSNAASRAKVPAPVSMALVL